MRYYVTSLEFEKQNDANGFCILSEVFSEKLFVKIISLREFADSCEIFYTVTKCFYFFRENYLFECTCNRCEVESGEISETSSSEDEDGDAEMED